MNKIRLYIWEGMYARLDVRASMMYDYILRGDRYNIKLSLVLGNMEILSKESPCDQFIGLSHMHI